MHIEIRDDLCVAGGQCVAAAPDLFDQRDDDGVVVLLRSDVPADRLEAARRAALLCPAAAIKLSEG
jgi:ferredoxin